MFPHQNVSAQSQSVKSASPRDEFIRTAVADMLPEGHPFRPVTSWSALDCAVCGAPALGRRVTLLDHGRSQAVATGHCGRIGCAALLRAVTQVFVLDRPDREVTERAVVCP